MSIASDLAIAAWKTFRVSKWSLCSTVVPLAISRHPLPTPHFKDKVAAVVVVDVVVVAVVVVVAS